MLTTWLVARTGKKAGKAACLGEFSTRKALGTHSCYSLTSPRVLSLQSLRGASGRSQKHQTKATEMLIKVSAAWAAWFCATGGKGVHDKKERENGQVRPKWANNDSDRTHGARQMTRVTLRPHCPHQSSIRVRTLDGLPVLASPVRLPCPDRWAQEPRDRPYIPHTDFQALCAISPPPETPSLLHSDYEACLSVVCEGQGYPEAV